MQRIILALQVLLTKICTWISCKFTWNIWFCTNWRRTYYMLVLWYRFYFVCVSLFCFAFWFVFKNSFILRRLDRGAETILTLHEGRRPSVWAGFETSITLKSVPSATTMLRAQHFFHCNIYMHAHTHTHTHKHTLTLLLSFANWRKVTPSWNLSPK